MSDNTPKKTLAYYELDGQPVMGPVRVGLKTKLQYERTSKARGWDVESQPFTTSLFWAWHASKLAGNHDLSFDDFSSQAVDTWLVTEDGAAVDPTNQGSTDIS